MQTSFKTPVILNFLNYIKTQNPAHKNLIDRFIPLFQDIDLSKHDFSQETFLQSINLATNETIYLTWNIDAIIQDVARSQVVPITLSTNWILSNLGYGLTDPIFESTYNTVRQNMHRQFTYKSNYIIIGTLPVFFGYSIIDGNHRFCRALLTHQESINAVCLNAQYAAQFLQPDSQKFIVLLNELVQRLE